jgi:hypothetical protein
MMLSMASIFVWEFGLPSVKMWVDRVRIDAVIWAKAGIRQVMWLVMLESAKNQILGVDNTGQ